MLPSAAIEAYSVIFLRHENQFLLLQRSPTRQFAPCRWTGVGGHVEVNEYGDIYASALRELGEETGFSLADVENFKMRRAILTNRPGFPMGVLFYFTGVLKRFSLPECPEGTLAWVSPAQFDALDIIETSRLALLCLVQDMERDPSGAELACTGLSVFAPDGQFQRVVWGDAAVTGPSTRPGQPG